VELANAVFMDGSRPYLNMIDENQMRFEENLVSNQLEAAIHATRPTSGVEPEFVLTGMAVGLKVKERALLLNPTTQGRGFKASAALNDRALVL
jgi:hypothetical protein